VPETAVFARAAVAAPHTFAAEAGRDVLAQGGDAIEAMVAMAATISVVYPHNTSIGGDGFWLIREPGGRVRAIEACGYAGAGASIAAYCALGLDAVPVRGPKAALTAPGALGGWMLALELSRARGGRLPLSLLLEDAVRRARDGYPVSASEARFDVTSDPDLVAAPGFADAFMIDGKQAEAGMTRRAPRLADALEQLGRAGLADFYRGDVGREIAADLERIGAPVTRDDLMRYRAEWREPLSLRLKKATLFNTPAPTQGLASLMLIGLYERLAPGKPEGFAHAHALIEAAKRAMAIRDQACVDFAHVTHDFGALLSAATLDREAALVDMRRAAPWPLPPDKGGTVWMGAIDAAGLAVSFIQSVFWDFGSGCVLPRTGVLMQNRGAAFSLDPKSRNPLNPGRRPFHTLNPPLAVFDDGRVLAYGSKGADGQPQFQAQVFTRIAAGAALDAALDAPRHFFTRAWGEPAATVKLEVGYDESTAAALAAAGHAIERRSAAECDSFGHAGALMRSPKGEIAAAHDPRSDGGAAGL
jgi:gamma-glutamyltranspeptidase/glutathione hydrolase